MDSVIRTRIDKDTKIKAMKKAKEMGFDLSTFIRMNIINFINDESKNILIPNETTIKSFEDYKKGAGVNRVKTIEELEKELEW